MCGLVSLSILSVGHLAVWSILAVGLFNSIMFPTIFTLGIAELGPLTGKGSGLMVAAIVGGAIIPYIEGLVADRIGVHHAFILPALCYIYIAYYGFEGLFPAFSEGLNSEDYSERSAVSGSTPAARRAGTRLAAIATIATPTAAKP